MYHSNMTNCKTAYKNVLYPLPYNNILDMSKLKAFPDDKQNPTKKLKFLIDRAENIVGKGENVCY